MLLFVSAAFANGLTTHVTICKDAVGLLPEGDLRDLLSDPLLADALQNGAQFPDGGYPIGAGYAEIAHWEPFQQAFRDTLTNPWDDAEARKLLAFNLGESCHGMADQVFDSLFIERLYVYDAASDFGNSFDMATDVALAYGRGGQEVAERYLPTDELIPVFAAVGHETDADTLSEGQTLTELAIVGVAALAEDETSAQETMAWFPWGSAHILDREIPGNPYDEAEVVARYWQVLWDKLHGERSALEPVMATFPADGGRGVTRDHAAVEARISVVTSRGLTSSAVTASFFHVVDEDGVTAEVEPWVYYGQSSHVIHLVPVADWAEDTDYTVTVDAGLPFIDGTTSDTPYVFTFSTRPPETEADADAPTPADAPCGCAQAGPTTLGAGVVLVGSALMRRRRDRRA